MTRFVRSYAAARFGLHMPEDMTENLLVEHGKLGVLDTLLAPYTHDYWMVRERAPTLAEVAGGLESALVDAKGEPVIRAPVLAHVVPAWAVEVASALYFLEPSAKEPETRQMFRDGDLQRMLAWVARDPVERSAVVLATRRLAGFVAVLQLWEPETPEEFSEWLRRSTEREPKETK